MKSRNPFIDRQAGRGVGEAGRRSETKLSKRLGGRTQPASGAMEGAKGDIKINEFLIEAKSTINDTMKVDLAWLCKISHEARHNGMAPALAISFVNEQGGVKKNGSWIAIEESKYKELLDQGLL